MPWGKQGGRRVYRIVGVGPRLSDGSIPTHPVGTAREIEKATTMAFTYSLRYPKQKVEIYGADPIMALLTYRNGARQ